MVIEVSKSQRLAAMFRALADPTRLTIFEALRCCSNDVAVSEQGNCQRVKGALTVGEVCCQLGGTPSTISHHLRELRLAGLILTEKRGRTILCSISPSALELLEEFVLQPCAAVSGTGVTAASDDKTTKILFICVHNSGRSQMAEAFFNTLARQRRVEAEAMSAGLTPGESINPMTIHAMAEVGLPIHTHLPKKLTGDMVNSADRIITMGCGVETAQCPSGTFVSEDWGLPDPQGQDIEGVRRVRDAVWKRVQGLVDEISE